MQPFKIIQSCKALGLDLFCEKEKLIVEHSQDCKPDPIKFNPLIERLKAQKLEVMEALAELEARAAVLEYEGGLTRSQAESQAFEELTAVGNDPQAAGYDSHQNEQPQGQQAENEQVRQWRGLIQSLPGSNSQDGARLVKYALAFLDSPLSLEAVSHGWDALALFGVFNGQLQAAKRRHDAMGLIPSLAWSKISGNLSGIEPRLKSLDREQAVIELKAINDRSGSKLFRNRKINSPDCSVIFWESQFLIGEYVS